MGIELNLKIIENIDIWQWVVFTGDGSKEGSLKAASMTETAEQALEEGVAAMTNQIVRLQCKHEWQIYLAGTPGIDRCTKCGKTAV